jgi:hypothetical protein
VDEYEYVGSVWRDKRGKYVCMYIKEENKNKKGDIYMYLKIIIIF